MRANLIRVTRFQGAFVEVPAHIRREGRFATDVHTIEMAVKDATRLPESWAYYTFGGPMTGGYRSTAAPQPKSGCFSCHAEQAARDNVFMQFYGLLNEAAPRK